MRGPGRAGRIERRHRRRRALHRRLSQASHGCGAARTCQCGATHGGGTRAGLGPTWAAARAQHTGDSAHERGPRTRTLRERRRGRGVRLTIRACLAAWSAQRGHGAHHLTRSLCRRVIGVRVRGLGFGVSYIVLGFVLAFVLGLGVELGLGLELELA